MEFDAGKGALNDRNRIIGNTHGTDSRGRMARTDVEEPTVVTRNEQEAAEFAEMLTRRPDVKTTVHSEGRFVQAVHLRGNSVRPLRDNPFAEALPVSGCCGLGGQVCALPDSRERLDPVVAPLECDAPGCF